MDYGLLGALGEGLKQGLASYQQVQEYKDKQEQLKRQQEMQERILGQKDTEIKQNAAIHGLIPTTNNGLLNEDQQNQEEETNLKPSSKLLPVKMHHLPMQIVSFVVISPKV